MIININILYIPLSLGLYAIIALDLMTTYINYLLKQYYSITLCIIKCASYIETGEMLNDDFSRRLECSNDCNRVESRCSYLIVNENDRNCG
jgi:hypothetical protein